MKPKPSLRRSPNWGWLIFVAVAAVLIASGVSITYTNRTAQQLCGLIRLQADTDPPPSTDRGRAFLAEAQKLKREYNC